METLSEKGGDN